MIDIMSSSGENVDQVIFDSLVENCNEIFIKCCFWIRNESDKYAQRRQIQIAYLRSLIRLHYRHEETL